MGEIPRGLCQCGCGEKTNIAKETRTKNGHIKGEPLKYLQSHHPPTVLKGKDHPQWRGGKTLSKGCLLIWDPSHLRSNQRGYVAEHIMIAERVLGKPLPPKAVVHHHTPEQLVICQDQAYHLFIHQRMRAFKACGNANWRKCTFCKQYDDPNNLTISGGNYVYHKKCATERERRKRETAINKD